MTLTLYRGDSVKIKQFEFNKTNKWCLLGQGIYLTNSLKVAQTYRTKDAGKSYMHQLFYGECDNRNEAYEKGFGGFCKVLWEKEHGWCTRYPTGTDQQKFEEKHRNKYRALIEAGEITADYTTRPVLDSGFSYYRNASQRIAKVKEEKKKHKAYIKVVWEEDPNIGYITKFEFEENKFEPFLLNVDVACNDEFFWSLMYDGGVRIGKQGGNMEEYIRANFGRKIFDCVAEGFVDPRGKHHSHKQDAWRKIGNILRPYGTIGMEYNGGVRLGGGHTHRAFCIWDEEFVNDHKVERFK